MQKHRDKESEAILQENKPLRTRGRKLGRRVDLLGDRIRERTGQDGERSRGLNRGLCVDPKLS